MYSTHVDRALGEACKALDQGLTVKFVIPATTNRGKATKVLNRLASAIGPAGEVVHRARPDGSEVAVLIRPSRGGAGVREPRPPKPQQGSGKAFAD